MKSERIQNKLNKTTIGLCITELEPGGAERAFTQLAVRANRSERYRIVVYVLSGVPDNPVLANIMLENQIPVRYLFLPPGNKWFALTRFPFAIRRYRQFLQEDRVALVQSFLFHANFINRAAHLGIVPFGRKAPQTVSGYRVCEPRGWQNWLDSLTRGWDAAAVAVSGSVKNFYVSKGHPKDWLNVIPNGIDGFEFSPENRKYRREIVSSLGISADSRILLSMGRLTVQKNLAFLIRQTTALLRETPNLVLLIAGQGEEKENLELLIRSLNLEKQVVLCGYRSDNARLMAAADILVLTSRWEGLPNVALEAAASGLPLVAFSSAGIAPLFARQDCGKSADWAAPEELCETGENLLNLDCLNQIIDVSPFITESESKKSGNLLLPATEDELRLGALLRERILWFLSNPELARETGFRNRNRVLAYFSWDEMAKSYEKLWQNLLNAQTPLDNNLNIR